MLDQALEPGQLVIELRAGLRIAIGKIQASHYQTGNRRLDVAAMRIVGIARQPTPYLDWVGAAREDRDAVPRGLAVPDRAVPRLAKCGCGKSGTVKVSHPERIFDPSTGLKKLNLVRYYESIGEWMLPHLKDRPVSLVRGPRGISGQLFFQKHDDNLSIPGLRELDPALWPGHAALLEVPTAEALISAAQMNVIEFHTWNSTIRNIDKPDRMVFDLDPGAGVAWTHVQEAALLTRALLMELGLASWLKTSGGKGLHVVVPLAPRLSYDTVKDFPQAIVQHLAQTIPARFVAKRGPANRVGRIFVDYLRNKHGATTVAAFSARARPGLGVSMPVAWEQLATLKSGAQWTISTAPRASVLSEDRPVGRLLGLRADTDGGDEGPGLQGAPGENASPPKAVELTEIEERLRRLEEAMPGRA